MTLFKHDTKGLIFCFGLSIVAVVSGCGVKGKPLPPLQPAEIGRGVPTYRRAAEQAKPTAVQELPTSKPSPSPDKGGK